MNDHIAALEAEISARDITERRLRAEINELKKVVQELNSNKAASRKLNDNTQSSVYKEELVIRRLVLAREKLLNDLGSVSSEIDTKLASFKQFELDTIMEQCDRESLVSANRDKQVEIERLSAALSRLDRQIQNHGSESDDLRADMDTVIGIISKALCSGLISFRTFRGSQPGGPFESRLVCVCPDEVIVLDTQSRKVWIRIAHDDYRFNPGSLDSQDDIHLRGIDEDVEFQFKIPHDQAVTGKWMWAFKAANGIGNVSEPKKVSNKFGSLQYEPLPPATSQGPRRTGSSFLQTGLNRGNMQSAPGSVSNFPRASMAPTNVETTSLRSFGSFVSGAPQPTRQTDPRFTSQGGL